MAHVFRSQFNQHEAFVEPLVAWLTKNGVNFERGAFVSDLDFTNTSGRMTVNRLHVQRANGPPTVTVAPDDIVLVTTGSRPPTSGLERWTRRRPRSPHIPDAKPHE